MLNSDFSTEFCSFNIFRSPSLVNIIVIKIITSNLADVWHTFSLILLTFYHVKGLVLAIKVYSN